jgi:hypothetical protein
LPVTHSGGQEWPLFLAATEGVFLTAASMMGPMANSGQSNGTEPYFSLVSVHGIYRDQARKPPFRANKRPSSGSKPRKFSFEVDHSLTR